jgi:hypothetical protein
MKEHKLGQVAGLSLSAEPTAVVGSFMMAALLSGVGMRVLGLSVGEALVGSLLAVILHWASDIAHHLGHAWAARRTGYPMCGIRLGKWGVLGTSLYPPDEQALPAAIHIRRALGGPAGSLLVSLLTAVAALLLRPVGGAPWWVGLFLFLDNLVLLTLGAFLPLGFTDGSTLLHWWGKR